MQQGLKENWKQFVVLVIVNAFVGGMVGLERSILPVLAAAKFNLTGHTLIISFIIAFGLAKAITNYIAGKYARRFGRKRILIAGWLFGLPIPFLLIFANSWDTIIVANVFLGLNQGLTWSTTVLMKIDLVGEKNRGFAMGLNEFAGYLALSIVAFVSSWIAMEYGIHPYPFYLGIAIVVIGLLLSGFVVEDTTFIAPLEKSSAPSQSSKQIFIDTTWKHRNLSSVTLAGFINNLNDAMAWGVIPLWMNSQGYSIGDIGLVAAVYPALWGIGQLFSGKLSDIFCKKDILTYGMVFQAIAIFLFPLMTSLNSLLILSGILGIGTALVYPTFLSSIAENTNVQNRPESLGVFGFWRDFGYVVGGLLVGISSDWFGFIFSVELVALLTISSAIIIVTRMYCPTETKSVTCFQG